MSDTAPDFRWSSLYFPELLEALIAFKSTDWPEHTETDVRDPVVRLLRLFAAVGHQHAVRLDHQARELLPRTLRLRSSAIELFALIGYELAPASPATTEIVADLSAALASTTTVVNAHSLIDDAGDPPVAFEYVSDTGLPVTATGTWSLVVDESGTLTAYTPGDGALWATPAVNDAVYLLHPEAMFTGVALELGAAASDLSGRWEYRDDLRELNPDSVTDLGSTIRLEVDELVGASDATGLEVTVTCQRTGVSETLTVAYSSTNRVTTTGTLGQSTVSTSAGDYVVACEWTELPDLADDTGGLTVDGEALWSLPQTAARRWAPDTVGDLEGYAVRWRVTSVDGSPVAPEIDAVADVASPTWSVLWPVTQGQRVVDTLGTTTGAGGESFALQLAPPFLSLVQLEVAGVVWDRVANFLASSPIDRHFTLQEQADESWRVTFGDGTHGAVPTTSSSVVATYRIGGDVDGNVGAGSLTRDRSGNVRLINHRNPRAAAGWVASEGSTDESLATVKVAAPASLQTLERVVTPDDAATLAVAYRTAAGRQLVSRANAIEEGGGLKTIELVCVGPGGIAPTTADLAELEEYYNGETINAQRVGGVGPANTEVQPVAFTPRAIAVTVSVDVLAAYATGAKARIEAALDAYLRPEARRLELVNGVWVIGDTYLWQFDGDVTRALLFMLIATATPGVVNVTLTTPAADVSLLEGELPVPGTVAVTVVSV